MRNIIVLCAGLLLLSVSFDWADLLAGIGFPGRELANPWVRADMATLRGVCVIIATAVISSRIVLWKYAEVFARLVNRIEVFRSTAAQSSFFVPIFLTALVSAKTVLQLALYKVGYSAYGADDFSRSLSADYWLYFRRFDLGWEGWLGLGGSGWLPFSDYLFGLGLALHRDLYFTPKIVNLIISGVAVIAVYFLGRELFGRAAGLVAACLFAFQPWHIWLGISGMTSDLPSVTLIALFGVFLVRWLQTDKPSNLLAAAGFLGVGNGFRYENWFFSAVFSLFIVFIVGTRWKRGRLARPRATVAVCALTMLNAFPILWMIASYLVLGDWLPALHVTNAWMVPFMAPPSPSTLASIPLAVNQSPYMAQINMLVLALGSFPIELALSMAGVAMVLRIAGRKLFRQYFFGLIATFLLFAVVFKGRLPASIVFARYFLPYVVLLLPFAGYFLLRLSRTPRPWQDEAVAGTCLIVLATSALDFGRAFNYPAMFPKDAIDAGWTVRNLEATGRISDRAKILIERGADWGDLGIVAIANKPERFVAINEFVYRQIVTKALPYRRGGKLALTALAEKEDVRGNTCDHGFQVDACKNSLVREKFSLVILSSPERVRSFQETFDFRSWTVGRYYIFDMTSLLTFGRSVRME